jgi:hypothetical protein
MRYEHAKSMTFSLLKKIYIGSKCLFFLFAVYCLLVFMQNLVFLGIGVSVNWLSSTLTLCSMFVFFFYESSSYDVILCYVILECAMFSVVVFYGIIAYVFLDVRFLVMIVFLIAIAACEISVGLMLLVRYAKC